ncbi:hypothetical protein [Bradyrhizobium sp. Leo170]|uniref:hypothetical protein n=1 Tax=Bradyrhizobium sp. Leo170 TaxID=1571199 RepID=UPI0032E4F5EA
MTTDQTREQHPTKQQARQHRRRPIDATRHRAARGIVREKNGERAFFYFDEVLGRRAINGRPSKDRARHRPGCVSCSRSVGHHLGRAWRETDEEDTDRETLLRQQMEGQYANPIRIVSFNTGEGWSRDATEEGAEELRQRCANRGEVPPPLQEFLDRHAQDAAIQLSLL